MAYDIVSMDDFYSSVSQSGLMCEGPLLEWTIVLSFFCYVLVCTYFPGIISSAASASVGGEKLKK